MKSLILLCVLLASCSPAPKTYTKPEIGMSSVQFNALCNVQGEYSTATTVTNSQGSRFTITLTDTPMTYPANLPKRDFPCVGTFTFVNDKLDSISR